MTGMHCSATECEAHRPRDGPAGARAVRDLALDCVQLAERVDRCQLKGADVLRAAAERYAHVADNLDATLHG